MRTGLPITDPSITFILLIVILVLVVILSPLFTSMINKIYKSVRNSMKNKSTEEVKISTVNEIKSAVESIAQVKKGATIVIDIKNETNEYVTDSEILDSRVTANLLINIFEGSKTPLHDGAVIIKENRIDRASAMIERISKQPVPKKFGTRHRSALGLSEVTKAIIIVISEETSKIRIFHKGKFEEVNEKDFNDRIVELWK